MQFQPVSTNHLAGKRSIIRTVACIIVASMATIAWVQASQYYVAPNGVDGASGSESNPWRTVSYATAVASAGDTVFFRAGVWSERLIPPRSGTVSNPITFRNYPGETPVLDGTYNTTYEWDIGIIDIRNNRSNIVIEGFEVRNLKTSIEQQIPIGIYVYGDPYTGAGTGGAPPSNITIRNCTVHSIETTHSEGNAHGIIVKNELTAVATNFVVSGCKVRNNKLGYSEALVVNGNVDGFEVTNNTVHDNNNIGIDIIGYESGFIPPGIDFARNGVVADNLVYNCSSLNNTSYGYHSAGGIYVDGGAHVVIERNRVYNCDIGIEIASEDEDGSTNNITVRNNIIWRNKMGGIFAGGYDDFRGSSDDCIITNNTLYENDTLEWGVGEILLRYQTNNFVIKNNIIVAGNERYFIKRENVASSNIVTDYNVYYASGTSSASQWQWNVGSGDGYITGFSNWQSITGQDANSTWGLPAFNNTSGALSTYDFCFSSGGLPQDKGDPAFTPAPGETDIAGNPRIIGSVVDSGAHEVEVPPTALETWRQTYFGTTENTGDAADLADSDKDGVVNLLEFAVTDGNPGAPDANANGGVFSVLRETNGDRVISFPRATDASELVTYEVNGHDELSGEWSQLAVRQAGGAWTSISGVTVSESGGVVNLTDSRTGLLRYFYALSVTP